MGERYPQMSVNILLSNDTKKQENLLLQHFNDFLHILSSQNLHLYSNFL